jgi:putative ABC transport system substrate-binding protein
MAVPVIGFLSALGRVATTKHAAFERGLAETGNINGKNVTIEYRFANGQYDRLPALAAEMFDADAVIVAQAPPTAIATGSGTSIHMMPVLPGKGVSAAAQCRPFDSVGVAD